MFKVGDMVQRTGKNYPLKRVGPFKVTQVNGMWFNHDGGIAADYHEGGGCCLKFWELAPEPTRQAARSTDPDTSKRAAIKAKSTPLRERINQYLCVGASATGTEIAAALDAKLNSVTPRFAELSRGDNPKIKDSGKRRDGQIVWVRA